MSEVTVVATEYVVSRLPATNVDWSVWSIRVVFAGHDKWAIRNGARCLNKRREWVYEPSPSNRSDGWLKKVRWDDLDKAIEVAKEVEATLTINGMTSQDVLAVQATWPMP